MPTEPRYETGKGGKVALGGANAYFSKWDMNLEQTYAPATDSSGYDEVTKALWRKQAPGSTGGSGSIEGFIDLDSADSPFLAALVASKPVAVELDYEVGLPFFIGSISIKNFKSGVVTEGGETIGFSCDYDTYGKPSFLFL